MSEPDLCATIAMRLPCGVTCSSLVQLAVLLVAGCAEQVFAPGTAPDTSSAPQSSELLPRSLPAMLGSDSELRFAGRAVFVPQPGGHADFIGSGAGAGMVLAYLAEPEGTEGEIWFEFGLDRTEHEDDSGRAAEYLRAAVGFRWSEHPFARTEAHISMGAAYHKVAVAGGDQLLAGGVYCGAGLTFLPLRAMFVSAELAIHAFWETSGEHRSGISSVLAGGLGVRF